MSAFSSHHHHLHFSVTNSISVPKTMSFLLQQQEKEEIINPSSSFSPIYPTTITEEAHFYDHIAHQISGSLNGNSIFNNVVKVPVACNIGSSLSEKQNSDSSSMVLEIDQAGDYNTHLEKKRKIMNCKVVREGKYKETEKCDNDGMPKDVKEKKMKAARKEKRKASEEAPTPTGYVHVRARRGQATDRHSLAERVRREKISERMRLLQSLVPGCDKVAGKALILDEIINYVQSLQNQVEFLVVKLATVYPIFTDIESTTPSSEEICNLEPPLQSLLQSAPFILQQDNNPNFLSQGSENFVEETEDQRQEVANHSGLNYLCSF